MYSSPDWGTGLLLGFFVVCNNLYRWWPCDPADPLPRASYPIAVNKLHMSGKREDLDCIGLGNEWNGVCRPLHRPVSHQNV
jgi:hypothetical protein